MATFAETIKQCRLDTGLNQGQFAKLLNLINPNLSGVDNVTIYRWESGRLMPHSTRLVKIFESLGKSSLNQLQQLELAPQKTLTKRFEIFYQRQFGSFEFPSIHQPRYTWINSRSVRWAGLSMQYHLTFSQQADKSENNNKSRWEQAELFIQLLNKVPTGCLCVLQEKTSLHVLKVGFQGVQSFQSMLLRLAEYLDKYSDIHDITFHPDDKNLESLFIALGAIKVNSEQYYIAREKLLFNLVYSVKYLSSKTLDVTH